MQKCWFLLKEAISLSNYSTLFSRKFILFFLQRFYLLCASPSLSFLWIVFNLWSPCYLGWASSSFSFKEYSVSLKRRWSYESLWESLRSLMESRSKWRNEQEWLSYSFSWVLGPAFLGTPFFGKLIKYKDYITLLKPPQNM